MTPTYFTLSTTDQEYLDWLQTAQAGDIAQLQHGLEYETFIERVNRSKGTNRTVDIRYCPPGHQLHAEYGANTVVVAVNEVVPLP